MIALAITPYDQSTARNPLPEDNVISDQIQEWLETSSQGQNARVVEDIFAISSDLGLQRSDNQDRVAILRVGSVARMTGFWCIAVCDGMGGMSDGAYAASKALSTFFEALIRLRRQRPEEKLFNATVNGSQAVRNSVKGGGATLSAVLIEDGVAYTVNVGDSRIYAVSESAGIPERLTVDDTMEEAYKSIGQGLLQYMGVDGELVPHISKVDCQNVKTVILTSDGAHIVGDEMLALLSEHSSDIGTLCTRVTTLASWLGGKDNATIGAIEIDKALRRSQEKAHSDISVWTLAGRLKIAWLERKSNSHHDFQDGHQNGLYFDPSPALRKETTGEETQKKNEQIAKKGRSKTQPKPKKDRSNSDRDEQIELGFSEEDDE